VRKGKTMTDDQDIKNIFTLVHTACMLYSHTPMMPIGLNSNSLIAGEIATNCLKSALSLSKDLDGLEKEEGEEDA
jgi:hypothetical protein